VIASQVGNVWVAGFSGSSPFKLRALFHG